MVRKTVNTDTPSNQSQGFQNLNFAALSPADLDTLASQITAARSSAVDRSRKALKDEIQAKVKEAGFKSVEEVMATIYRHPEDPSKEWAGKGPAPKWLQEWLGNGKGRSKEDLAV